MFLLFERFLGSCLVLVKIALKLWEFEETLVEKSFLTWSWMHANPCLFLFTYAKFNVGLSHKFRSSIYNSDTFRKTYMRTFYVTWNCSHGELCKGILLNTSTLARRSLLFRSSHQRCSVKKLFLKTSQYSQEIAFIRVSF